MQRLRRRTVRWLLFGALAIVLLLLVGSKVVQLYTDTLWFSALGHDGVLWTRIAAHIVVRLVTGALAAAIVLANLLFVTRHLGPVHLRRRYGNLEIAEQVPRIRITIGAVVVALLAGWWLSGMQFGAGPALGVLAWTRSVPWGVRDPLFGNDLSFYVYTLPVLTRFIGFLLLALLWSGLLAVLGYALTGALRIRDGRIDIDEAPRLHFALLLAAFLAVAGIRYWIGRYGVLLEGSGFGGAVGYTDVHARIPARHVVTLLALAATGAIIVGARRRNWKPMLVAVGALAAAAIVGGVVYPAAVQKLRVEPNQLARERPYIEWLIEHTRSGFALTSIVPQSWSPTRGPAAVRAQRPEWLDQLPLWDGAQLKDALQQETQRGYYEFHDVDFGRYRRNGTLVQVGIAAREFMRTGLPIDRQTWRNIHVDPTYTHGYGAVVTVASEAARGDPVFWLANVNPVERDPLAPLELDLREPRIYFGEHMQEYVVLNPAPDSAGRRTPLDSVTTGIPLSSMLRVLAFSWRFGDKNLLFSSERPPDSRLLFRRPVVERVQTLAPFLIWDPDAYPVIWRGRVVWFVDGYSASSAYPLSEPLQLPDGPTVRYIRNSAKAVVDALSGEVRLFAMSDDEPLLATYRRVFPDLFEGLDAMPRELQQHLRYPPLLASAQADRLERFHTTRPETFYSGQEAWQRPREVVAQGLLPYRPAFGIAALPGSERPEFLLSVPFIAAERQNMTALLLIRNDPPHYGEAVLLDVPTEVIVRGPGQAAALIEQDATISAQLTLWRRGDSNVQLGQLRVVPLDSSVLYVEPIYLSAAGSSLPQLQQVIVSDGAAVSMAPTLASAIDGLGRERAGELSTPDGEAPALMPPGTWAAEALRLQEAADRALRAGDWAAFGDRWNELQTVLRRAATARPTSP